MYDNTHTPNAYYWSYTSSPAEEPVTYAQAAAQIRSDDDTEQSLVTSYITAARLYGEQQTGRTWVQRNVVAQFYSSRDKYILPRGPVQSITSVYDGLGNLVSDDFYQLRRVGSNDYIWFQQIPTVGVNQFVAINYVAGYGDASAVPGDLAQAVLLHVGSMYGNRESISDKQSYPLAHGLDAIYDAYRINQMIG